VAYTKTTIREGARTRSEQTTVEKHRPQGRKMFRVEEYDTFFYTLTVNKNSIFYQCAFF
jgi:hypothetical protein